MTGSSCFAHAAEITSGGGHYYTEASCIYVNNAGPWNAIKHLGYHCT